MAQVVGFLLAFVLVFAVLKAAIIALVVAGLIFRTKVTASLLLVGGLLNFLGNNPGAGIALLATAAVVGAILAARKRRTAAELKPERLRIQRALDDPDQE